MKPFGLRRTAAVSKMEVEPRTSVKRGRFTRPLVPHSAATNAHVGRGGKGGELTLSLLFRASLRLQAALDRCFLPLGTTAQEAAVLLCCADAGAISARGLADALGKDQGNVTRFLDRLESRRLVTRRCHSRDRRLLVIEATHRGRQLAPQIRSMFEEAESKFFAEIPPDDIAQLELRLSQLLASADRLAAKSVAKGDGVAASG
jgi:DNA-binding MarR family transcriptional regulator